MLARIIFCCAIISAILVVVLLAIFSPGVQTNHSSNQASSLALSLYIQQPQVANFNRAHPTTAPPGGAFIFHRSLTDGPDNTSQVVGKAQGFIFPTEQFAESDFNVIYLTFHTPRYSGSLSVQAKHVGHKDSEELTVVGGTGSFAFAKGIAVFVQTDHQGLDDSTDSTYRVKLQLRLPNRSDQITPQY